VFLHSSSFLILPSSSFLPQIRIVKTVLIPGFIPGKKVKRGSRMKKLGFPTIRVTLSFPVSTEPAYCFNSSALSEPTGNSDG
jgi:hypothetical protein